MPLVIKDKGCMWVAVSEEELGIRLYDSAATNLLPSNNMVRKIENSNIIICSQHSIELDFLERILKSKNLKRLNYDCIDKEVFKEVLEYSNKLSRNKEGKRLCFPSLIISNNQIYRMENYGYIYKPKESCFIGPYSRGQVAESSLEVHKAKNPIEQIKKVYKDLHEYTKTQSGNLYIYNTKNNDVLIIKEVEL